MDKQVIAALVAGMMARASSGEIKEATWQQRAVDAAVAIAKLIDEASGGGATVAKPAPKPNAGSGSGKVTLRSTAPETTV